MKTSIILCSLILVGCATCPQVEPEVRYVNKEVWTPPKFDRPERPILRDSDNTNDGQMVRNTSLNMLDLMKYAEELEKIVNNIK